MSNGTHVEKGPIVPALLSFALPVLVLQLMQEMYNITDCMIVGHFGGEHALLLVLLLPKYRRTIKRYSLVIRKSSEKEDQEKLTALLAGVGADTKHLRGGHLAFVSSPGLYIEQLLGLLLLLL